MTADVQRELEPVVRSVIGWPSTTDAVVAALLPTVQQLIDDAEKRAAAAALREFADGIYIDEGTRYDDRVRIVAAAHRRAAALDPAGAASGETTTAPQDKPFIRYGESVADGGDRWP